VLWKLPVIKIAPDVIIPLFPDGTGITNTLLGTWIAIIALVALFYFGTRRRDLIPHGVQNLVEWAVELLLNLVESVAGKANAKRFFPLVATFFIFILFANLLDIFPGVDTIGWVNLTAVKAAHLSPPTSIFLFGDHTNLLVPWLRPATTDLNLNIGMALISVLVTQIFGFYLLGPKQYLSRYFNFSNPINFYVGILELVSEFARIISLSFRLFGNIFAGSIVLAIFALLLPVVGDIIFIPFELFIAFIQAFIFSLLTLVFLQITVSSHEEHGPESEHEARAEFARNEEKELAGAKS
jgi:F-type H+-transporting ATPase subunit a